MALIESEWMTVCLKDPRVPSEGCLDTGKLCIKDRLSTSHFGRASTQGKSEVETAASESKTSTEGQEVSINSPVADDVPGSFFF
jgi:hypothetical protein